MGNTAPSRIGFNLTWSANGTLRVLGVTDPFNASNNQACTYGHDDLGRIASANCGASIWNQTFSSDAVGNLKKDVPPGSTGTSFQPTYDVTTNRISSSPFTYNVSSGTMTNDGLHGYGWDAENRLSTVDPGLSSGACLTYDALGRVVELAKGPTCTSSYNQVVYGPGSQRLAVMNGTTLQKAMIALPGGATAVYKTAGLSYYRHEDWLGSARLSSTPSRALYYDVSYAPYGESYKGYVGGGGSAVLAFTGQSQDTATGIYDFLFREYSPVQGRWLSPDPAGIGAVDLGRPQTWNRYAYVKNQPVRTIDPLGLCDVVVGGITQAPGSPATVAETEFANAIGANLVFPYSGTSNIGLVLDVANIAGQGLGANTNAVQAVENAIMDAARSSGPINVFSFSGGAQAVASAMSRLPTSVASRVTLTYVSPGGVSDLAQGSGETTVVSNRYGLMDNALMLGSTGSATLLWTNSEHAGNAAFTDNLGYLMSRRGTACPLPATYTVPGIGGGGGYGFGVGGPFGPGYGYGMFSALNDFLTWLHSIEIEVVTHELIF